ncbi:hypothetical protein PENSPDRAFT_461013 [Peniophora sp. CONT]|nr:hypothetical protein PENSPDRAFT_461013 [Peniophora sp. CONT]
MSSATATSSPTADSGNNSTKLIIIIVSCLGGFLFVFGLVCIVVPILRRRVARRGPRRDLENDSMPGAHARLASEAGAPLLYSKEIQGHDRDLSASSIGHGAGADTDLHEPAANLSYTPYSTDSPPMPQRPPPPRQPQPLRHARTRIRAPMAPVPEDELPPTPKSTRRTSIRTASPPVSPPPQSDEHPSWLHIPTAGPLISAFRRSIAASTSTGKTSMTGQSYHQSSVPPLPTSHLDNAGSVEALTIRSFTSGASSGHEHGLPPPPRDVPARLRPSGGPERVAQLVVPRHNELNTPGSRAASLLSAPLSNTGASSRSGVSVYTDARSDLGGASELGERSLRSIPSRP